MATIFNYIQKFNDISEKLHKMKDQRKEHYDSTSSPVSQSNPLSQSRAISQNSIESQNSFEQALLKFYIGSLMIIVFHIICVMYSIILIRRCVTNQFFKVILILFSLFTPGVAQLLIIGLLLAGCKNTSSSSKSKKKSSKK
jgi:hypothetical protein